MGMIKSATGASGRRSQAGLAWRFGLYRRIESAMTGVSVEAPSPREPTRTVRLSRRVQGRWVMLAAALAIAVTAAMLEIGLEGRDPLWLDESWTGGIIGQPSWPETFHQIYADVNAPLYYVLIRLWSGVAGLSDLALRAPSLICAGGAVLAAALVPSPGLSRAERLGWAAVLAWWFPTLCYAQEARCYALLLLVCTLQTLAFMRLMRRPERGPAAVWAALAATAILTHYDALYLGAAQGLLYLARYPVRALRSWPAALAFVPAFGWLAYHWPRIAQFARPEIAWYAPLSLGQLPPVAGYLVDGGQSALVWMLLVAVSAASLRMALPPRPQRAEIAGQAPPSVGASVSGLGWATAAAALAAAALIGVGFLRPSFTLRYLTPSAPGLLLGLVWLTGQVAGRRGAPAAVAILSAVYLGLGGWMLTHHLRMAPKRYNFEAASAMLGATHPARLVFLWDHPVDPILEPSQLSALGGFFLHRAGVAVAVTPVVLAPGEDPNTRLLHDAAAPRSVILWVYDRVVKGTAAMRRPPQISRRDPTFACRQYASGRFGVLACWRPTEMVGAPQSSAHQRGGAWQPQG